MKKSLTVLLGLIICLAAVIAAAQMGPPTPAPELKKLDFFSGSWTVEATIGPGPWGSGGKFTSTTTTEWLKGDFFLVSHGDFSMPAELGGSGTAIAVFSYDPDKKVYMQDVFNGNGQRQKSTLVLNGDTWTVTGEDVYGGMTIQRREIRKVVSPTSYTTKYEVSADGGATWMSFWDGKATKK